MKLLIKADTNENKAIMDCMDLWIPEIMEGKLPAPIRYKGRNLYVVTYGVYAGTTDGKQIGMVTLYADQIKNGLSISGSYQEFGK